MTRLILPIPPSLNHSHINIRRGNRLMRIQSEVTKQYKRDAYWIAKDWCTKTGWTLAAEKVKMRYWIWWPDARKRDMDNVLKVLLDSLAGVVYENDRQVLPQAMDYAIDRKNPRIEIELLMVGDNDVQKNASSHKR